MPDTINNSNDSQIEQDFEKKPPVRRRRRLKKNLYYFLGVGVSLVLAALVFGAMHLYSLLGTPISDVEVTDEIKDVIDLPIEGQYNVLLLGCDISEVRTDTIMLINVDKTNKTIRMLSIPRDTKIKTERYTDKINSSVPRGGIELLIKNIKSLTGIPIHYYVMAGPGTFAAIIDELGGVEYDVERDMYYRDPSQDLYINLKKGLQILTGEQAEHYCRYRSYAMGDITRTQHQQKFLKALIEQKMKLEYIDKVDDLFNTVKANIQTNVTLRTILSNIKVLQMFEKGVEVETIDVPGTYNDMQKEGISYYLIEGEHKQELLRLCAEKFMGMGEPIEDSSSLDDDSSSAETILDKAAADEERWQSNLKI